MLRRTVVVYGKNDSILAAPDRQLPQELQEGLRGILVDIFEINIQAVQIELDRLGDQVAHQPLAGRGPRQDLIIHDTVLVGNVLHQPPDFDAVLVTVVHIGLAGQGLDIPLVVTQEKPGGRDRGEPLRVRDHFQHIAVRVRICHLVPGHINGIVFRNIRVLRLLIIRGQSLLAPRSQEFIADVADKAVGCPDLRPIAHILVLRQDVKGLSLRHIRQNRALDAGPVADLGVALHLRRIHSAKLRRDIDPVHLVRHNLVLKPGIFLDIRQRHIGRIPVHLHRRVALREALAARRIGLASHRGSDHLRRCRVQQQILRLIPVETVVQIIIQRVRGHIDLSVDHPALELRQLIIQDHSHLILFRRGIIFRPRHALLGRTVFIYQIADKQSSRDENNQYQGCQDRRDPSVYLRSSFSSSFCRHCRILLFPLS